MTRLLRVLRRRLRTWLREAWAAVADRAGLGGPRVLRKTVDRTRRLQQRHAMLAYRAPFTTTRPRLARGLQDRGFE